MLHRQKRDTERYTMEPFKTQWSGKQIPFGVEEGAPNRTALVGELCPTHTEDRV